MKLHRLIYLVFAVGIVSSAIAIYFYILQRDFTKNHREFLISINKLENTQSDLTYHILKSSLFAYQNQDEISQIEQKLQDEYTFLENSAILKNKNYKTTKDSFVLLKAQIQLNSNIIEKYVMLNAGIKNSLLFLTRHVESATILATDDEKLFLKANSEFFSSERTF